MRVAITTDWLNSFGGAERVLIELHQMFPEAPIYTAVHDPAGLPKAMQGWDVRTSFLQRVPLARSRHRAFLPLMPLAFEELDLSAYDVVLTTSSAFAKGVLTRPDALNICYCYTPPRYLWDLYHEYVRGRSARAFIAPVARWLRRRDRVAADRVDEFLTTSYEVAGRIRKHYGREAEVIPPPVAVDHFLPNGQAPEDFYLVVSRLVGYKRVDLAVAVANRLRRRLLVVGEGPERARLRAIAGPTVELLGRLDDQAVAGLYARCKALLFPGHEDFGITPVEAQAAGRPVIAYGRGGALETVLDGETGIFFGEQSVDALADAISCFEASSFDPADCRRNAERFERGEFRRRLGAAIAARVSAPRVSIPPHAPDAPPIGAMAAPAGPPR